MKKLVFAGLALVLPLAAQSPQEAIRNYQLTLPPGDPLNRLVLQLNDVGAFYGRLGGVVKNAPYSADAVTETTQSLADGNKIVQSTTQKLYRDTDGRERREGSVMSVGALNIAQPGQSQTISINDPVDNVSYTLNPQAHTATKGQRGLSWLTGPGGDVGVTYRVRAGDVLVQGRGGRGARGENTSAPAKQDLGSKNIEGVIAQGTRTTQTIPAGQIGNQLPINIVDEVWYSSELQMNVMTSHSDPRSGETVYKLTNISRANPPRSLFEPPPDYSITDTGAGRGRGARGGAQK